MATITLAEASKLGLDDVQAGVIENIVTVNALYQVLPFDMIDGNALAYTRESVLGDAEVLGIGGTITAKAQAEYTRMTATLTTILGDAEVDGRIRAQGIGGNAGNDVVAAQIASKAKSVGRKFQDMFINGDSNVDGQFDGLSKLVSSSQTIDANAAALDFALLDDLTSAVTAKNGQVDFIMMNGKAINKLKALLRALGGAAIDIVQMGLGEDGRPNMVLVYDGIPVFRNDDIKIDAVTGLTEVFAGTFNDGTGNGIAGLTAANGAGIIVEAVGPMENKDASLWRVKFYSGLVSYSDLGLAKIGDVKVR